MGDKTLIIKRIKEAYSLRTNVEVARFLGVSAQVLSNWLNRNTVNYDTIIPKCPEINLNWLFRGEGEVYLNGKPVFAMASEEKKSYKKVATKKPRVAKAKSAKKSVETVKSKTKKS